MVMTRVARTVVLCIAVLVASACTGGDDDATDSFEAYELPANLCDAVPRDLVEKWGLTDAEHETSSDADVVTATCTMDGTYESGPVTLRLRATTLPGATESDALDAARSSVTDQCRELENSSVGRFADDDYGCTDLERDDDPDALEARASEVSLAIPLAGVVTGEMTHTGPGWQIVQPTLTGLMGHLATSDAEDLVESTS